LETGLTQLKKRWFSSVFLWRTQGLMDAKPYPRRCLQHRCAQPVVVSKCAKTAVTASFADEKKMPDNLGCRKR
jgi:hypothetical protein